MFLFFSYSFHVFFSFTFWNEIFFSFEMAPPSSYKGYNHQGKCRHDQLSSPVKKEIRQQLNLLNLVENADDDDDCIDASSSFFSDDDDGDCEQAMDVNIADLNLNINDRPSSNNQHTTAVKMNGQQIDWPELDEKQSQNLNKKKVEKSNKKQKNPLSFVAALLSPKKKN